MNLCELESLITELKSEASRIKQDTRYQKLNVKANRNPTEQNIFNGYRRRLNDIENQINAHEKSIIDTKTLKNPCEPQTVAWKIPKNTAERHDMAQKKSNIFNSNNHVIINTSKIRTQKQLDGSGLDEFMGK